MNRDAMTKRPAFAALIAFAAALSACGGGAPDASLDRSQTQGVVLEGSTIGGPFELVGSGGKTVKWGDFAGKYRMVYFGYT